jgi:hypothetical protein
MESGSRLPPPPSQEREEGSRGGVLAHEERPSTSHKRKRAGKKGAGRSTISRKNSCCFDLLDQDCRVWILRFLGLEDLGTAADVCKQFRDDCRHESLPQERTAVVRIPSDCPDRDRVRCLGTRLMVMAAATTRDGGRRFRHFGRLRIVDPSAEVHLADYWRPPSGAAIPEITALDWSGVRSGSGRTCADYTAEQYRLARMLPNLREVDFSHSRTVCNTALHSLSGTHRLEKVTWHGHWCCLGLYGLQLSRAGSLKELYMDGACFEESVFNLRLFVDLRDRLERVSIKGATSCYPRSGDPAQPIAQSELAEFVRNAPNLRWFRSDLTPENAATLQMERPDVTFAS